MGRASSQTMWGQFEVCLTNVKGWGWGCRVIFRAIILLSLNSYLVIGLIGWKNFFITILGVWIWDLEHEILFWMKLLLTSRNWKWSIDWWLFDQSNLSAVLIFYGSLQNPTLNWYRIISYKNIVNSYGFW